MASFFKATRIIPVIMLLLVCTSTHGYAITYNVFQMISTASVSGEITTNGDLGQLDFSDFLDWNLVLDNGGGTTTSLLGPLSGANSSINTVPSNSGMVATATDLTFNYLLGGNFTINGGGNGDWCNAGTTGNPCTVTNPDALVVIDDTFFSQAPTANQVIIGTAVPLPSTIPLFALSLLGLAGFQWHQRRRERTQVA